MSMPQKRVASVSSRSTPTHATAPAGGLLASHDETSIVFPLPAEADTSVTGPRAPRSSSANSRGRSTRPATEA